MVRPVGASYVEPMEDGGIGGGPSPIDWDALAAAKRERWLALYRADPLASVAQVWARGRHARAVTPPEVLERARAEDLQHHIELKETIARIGPLVG